MYGTVDATRFSHAVCGKSMRFPYTLNIARSIDKGDEIVVLRPEVSIRIVGPAGIAETLALVDTGADNSVFPLSIARHLQIETALGEGPAATAFGGQQIPLSFAEVILELSDDDASIRWHGRLYFADFPNDSEKAVILGHEGFLDYFTATFDGNNCVLNLDPNDDIPLA
jgi:hypothetical protein